MGNGLPPVQPIVLYNGSSAGRPRQTSTTWVQPEPPTFLRGYQPRLSYYLIDEGATVTRAPQKTR
ncbi:hypothetical protein DSL92_06195 [Billgrantia gudaonensis]|uniref:Uncharacterized protein n=1 Tax=Billgrantia gudaonensis TaxID=376427 RepID=A0A3S0QRN6_9GAMM|nr:hypothetical protein DSL92_06195 [Halomonas gudaonensis]